MIKVNGKEIEWKAGMTIDEVFRLMQYEYPQTAVTVNDTFVAPEEYDSFQIEDHATVKIIHICHGG